MPIGCEQKRLARCFRAEFARVGTARIRPHSDSGNLRRAPLQISVVPLRTGVGRLHKQHVSENLSLQPRHDLGQLADTRAGARTKWMRDHHQRWATGSSRKCYVRPLLRGRSLWPGLRVVLEENTKAASDYGEPGEPEYYPQHVFGSCLQKYCSLSEQGPFHCPHAGTASLLAFLRSEATTSPLPFPAVAFSTTRKNSATSIGLVR